MNTRFKKVLNLVLSLFMLFSVIDYSIVSKVKAELPLPNIINQFDLETHQGDAGYLDGDYLVFTPRSWNNEVARYTKATKEVIVYDGITDTPLRTYTSDATDSKYKIVNRTNENGIASTIEIFIGNSQALAGEDASIYNNFKFGKKFKVEFRYENVESSNYTQTHAKYDIMENIYDIIKIEDEAGKRLSDKAAEEIYVEKTNNPASKIALSPSRIYDQDQTDKLNHATVKVSGLKPGVYNLVIKYANYTITRRISITTDTWELFKDQNLSNAGVVNYYDGIHFLNNAEDLLPSVAYDNIEAVFNIEDLKQYAETNKHVTAELVTSLIDENSALWNTAKTAATSKNKTFAYLFSVVAKSPEIQTIPAGIYGTFDIPSELLNVENLEIMAFKKDGTTSKVYNYRNTSLNTLSFKTIAHENDSTEEGGVAYAFVYDAPKVEANITNEDGTAVANGNGIVKVGELGKGFFDATKWPTVTDGKYTLSDFPKDGLYFAELRKLSPEGSAKWVGISVDGGAIQIHQSGSADKTTIYDRIGLTFQNTDSNVPLFMVDEVEAAFLDAKADGTYDFTELRNYVTANCGSYSRFDLQVTAKQETNEEVKEVLSQLGKVDVATFKFVTLGSVSSAQKPDLFPEKGLMNKLTVTMSMEKFEDVAGLQLYAVQNGKATLVPTTYNSNLNTITFETVEAQNEASAAVYALVTQNKEVMVANENGTPVTTEGATVRIMQLDRKDIITLPIENGKFSVPDLEPGTYIAEVRKNTQSAIWKRFIVGKDGNFQINQDSSNKTVTVYDKIGLSWKREGNVPLIAIPQIEDIFAENLENKNEFDFADLRNHAASISTDYTRIGATVLIKEVTEEARVNKAKELLEVGNRKIATLFEIWLKVDIVGTDKSYEVALKNSAYMNMFYPEVEGATSWEEHYIQGDKAQLATYNYGALTTVQVNEGDEQPIYAFTYEDTTYSISGVVYDKEGKVVEGAKVELLDAKGNVVATTLTDENGKYQFTDVPNGEYSIRVTYPDGIVAKQGIVVENKNVDDVVIDSEDFTDYVIDGIVKDEEEKEVQGAKVVLSKNGVNPFEKETYTDENGYYKFDSLPDGSYTLTITKGDKTVTKQIIIPEEMDGNVNFADYSTKIEVSEKLPSTAVSNLDDALTDEEKEISPGTSVTITLEVKEIVAEKVEEVIEAISAKLPNNHKIGLYFDAKLWKTTQVGNGKPTDVTIQPAKSISITIDIPEAMWDKENFKVIRMHENEDGTVEVKTLPDTVYNSKYHTLTFKTDKFSAFAITFENETVNKLEITGPLPNVGDKADMSGVTIHGDGFEILDRYVATATTGDLGYVPVATGSDLTAEEEYYYVVEVRVPEDTTLTEPFIITVNGENYVAEVINNGNGTYKIVLPMDAVYGEEEPEPEPEYRPTRPTGPTYSNEFYKNGKGDVTVSAKGTDGSTVSVIDRTPSKDASKSFDVNFRGDFQNEATIKIKVNEPNGSVVRVRVTENGVSTIKEYTVKNGEIVIRVNPKGKVSIDILKDELDMNDLSAYSNMKLDVYANSRVISVTPNANGFDVYGYMWINGVRPTVNTWREIIFVNAEDYATSKAYRANVSAVYNPFLNSNPIATNNGTLDLSYACYKGSINKLAVESYDKTTKGAMAQGTYLVFMRISDGVNSYLFPLVDRTLNDGSNMENTGTLPSGFSVADQTTRNLVYSVR